MSSSLRAAARSRTIPALRFHRTITTRGKGPESSSEKIPGLPRSPPTLVDNAPGWNEDLATTSEAFVKADRETTTIEQMQKKTVDYVQSHHHHDPEVAPTHATYAREEIGGPLGNAGVGEFEGIVGNDDLGPDDAQVESNGRVVTRRVTREKTTVRDEGESSPGQAHVSRKHEEALDRVTPNLK